MTVTIDILRARENIMIAKAIGLIPMRDLQEGAFWDPHLCEMRVVPQSEAWEHRRNLGIRDDRKPGISFDVYRNVSDLTRAEDYFAVKAHNVEDRVKFLLNIIPKNTYFLTPRYLVCKLRHL